MPEGPEVASRAKELAHLLVGKEYRKITIVSGAYKTKKDELHNNFRLAITTLNRLAQKQDVKMQFTRVGAKGKYLYFELQLFLQNPQSGKWESRGYKYIGTHFMMSGAWLEQPSKHTRVELEYGNDRVLYYDDTRDFGEIEILTKIQIQEKLNSLGPDILGKISEEQFREQLSKVSKSMIGSAIKDQSLVSGIGNYMRADILYRARISPRRKINSLDDKEWHALYESSRKVAQDSLAAGGTAAYNPQSGSYVPIIYGKSTDPKGNPIEKMAMGGQTLYWVPAMQK
jgi:formamidopyrimidine-DNA glycosylase